jgi:aryl-alcohol dehydrogenase-like predicted oxidoreductase
MEMRRLGQTNVEITPVGLGCWQFAQGKGFSGQIWPSIDQTTVTGVVEAALKGGVTWFDTAEAYGGGQSERSLSAALHGLEVEAGDVVVATKWQPVGRRAASIPKTIDARLDCLQGYPIDLFQVHNPWGFSSVASEMSEMARLVRAGKIRTVGVSNFSARQMAAASEALRAEGLGLASNQVSISLVDRRIERNGVLAAARGLGVTLIAYSPLAQGLLTGRYHDDPALVQTLPFGRRSRLSPASRNFSAKGLARSAPLLDALREIAAAHGASMAQVALSWLITHYGETVVAIPGASRPEQATESAAAMDLRLEDKEMSRLDEVSRRVARL